MHEDQRDYILVFVRYEREAMARVPVLCSGGGLWTGTRRSDSRLRLTVVHVVRGHEGVVYGNDIDVLVVPRCSQDQPIRKTSQGETDTHSETAEGRDILRKVVMHADRKQQAATAAAQSTTIQTLVLESLLCEQCGDQTQEGILSRNLRPRPSAADPRAREAAAPLCVGLAGWIHVIIINVAEARTNFLFAAKPRRTRHHVALGAGKRAEMCWGSPPDPSEPVDSDGDHDFCCLSC